MHLAPDEDTRLTAREAFVADALRPAETTHAGARRRVITVAEALDDLALVEASDEREEALAVACAMRAALADRMAAPRR